MSDIVTWDLWLHPDGRHSWRDPASRWHSEPAAPWSRHGSFQLRQWGARRGVLPRDVRRLPRGTLLAGSGPQNHGLGGPHYIYRDIQGTCRDCRRSFVFTAAEQKHWFETLRLWNEIIARACPDCRHSQRRERISHDRLAQAIARLAEAPSDEEAHFQAARATMFLVERIGLPALQRGLGYARRAQRRGDLAEEARQFEQAISAEIASRSS